jgi:hypothetical protein
MVLRQQVLIQSQTSLARVRLGNLDRVILVWLYRFFPSLLSAILVVKPETRLLSDRSHAQNPIWPFSPLSNACFISLALSSGEDPGWVAQVCGTSEQMIFRHYRRWIPQVGAGRRINRLFEKASEVATTGKVSLKPSLSARAKAKAQQSQGYLLVGAGGIEPPSDFAPVYRESA